jgi:hypothetical protein
MLHIENTPLQKYAAKTGIPPTTYRSRGFLPCGVGEKILLKRCIGIFYRSGVLEFSLMFRPDWLACR